MKKFVITEEEKNDILKQYKVKNIISEQYKWLKNIFTNSSELVTKYGDDAANISDELVANYGDDAAKILDNALGKIFNEGNVITKTDGTKYILSASGTQIKMSTIENIIYLVGKGRLNPDDVINQFPRKLADGSDFRVEMDKAFKMKKGGTLGSNVAGKVSGNIASWVKTKWFSTSPTSNLANLFDKVNKLKNIRFNPKNVKITNRTNIYRREVLELKLPTGDDLLIYESIGEGAPELKQAGDWQVINGFMPNPANPSDVKWFIKSVETTQLTKGVNQYLTDLANFLKANGPNSLGL